MEQRIVWKGGVWLKAERVKRDNLSAERLAQEMKVSRATVVRLEADESDPAYSTLVRLARALGLSIEEVAKAGEGEPRATLRSHV